MIEKFDGIMRENEIEVYGFLASVNPIKKNRFNAFLNLLKEQDGFVGVCPHKFLLACLFKTENDAKGARNILKYHGYKVSDIQKAYIQKEYMEDNT